MFDSNRIATEIVQGVRGPLSPAGSDILLASDASDATLFSAFADLPSARGNLAHLKLTPALKNLTTPFFSSSLTIAPLIRALSPRQSKHRVKHTILQGFPDLLEFQPLSYSLPPPHTIAGWCERVDGVGPLQTDSPPAQPQAVPGSFIEAYEDTEGNALITNNYSTRTSNVEEFPEVGPVPVFVQPSAQGHLPPKRHRPLVQPLYTAAEHSGQSFSIPRLTGTICPPTRTSSPAPTSRRGILHTPCTSTDPSGQSFSRPGIRTAHRPALCDDTAVQPGARDPSAPPSTPHMAVDYGADFLRRPVVDRSFTQPAPAGLPSARARYLPPARVQTPYMTTERDWKEPITPSLRASSSRSSSSSWPLSGTNYSARLFGSTPDGQPQCGGYPDSESRRAMMLSFARKS